MRTHGLWILGLALAGCGYTPGPEAVETREIMKTIVDGINAYKKDVGRYPQKLSAIIDKPVPTAIEAKKWKGPYLKSLPKDAWGKDFFYNMPGKNGLGFDLISMGEDGKWGGKKDAQEIAWDDKSLNLKK